MGEGDKEKEEGRDPKSENTVIKLFARKAKLFVRH